MSNDLGGQTALRRSNSRDLTTVIWAAVLGISPGEAWLQRDEPKSADLIARYEKVMAELDRGAPFAYAVGSIGFRNLDLKIDPRAMIPRPETEGLVELLLKHGSQEPGVGRRGFVADIGTGSGCIALALAVEGDFERVIAVEQSLAAAALARENVKRIAPPTPVEICEGNLLVPLADRGERFRAIVSNPPYVSAVEYDALDASVHDFEPREALVSGASGLDASRGLFAGAARLLEPGGLLAIEIDERRADAVQELGQEYGWTVAIHDDLFGRHRYALATKEEAC